MNKKGQFFLIAALVIVAILLSLGTIYNKARVQKSDSKVYDLSKEITYEGAKVIDSGFYSSSSADERRNRLNTLVSNYSNANKDTDIIAIYGDVGNLSLANYTYICNPVGVGGAEGCSYQLSNNPSFTQISPNGGNVTVQVGGNSYTFELKSGQNFYILMRKSKSGETYVASQ